MLVIDALGPATGQFVLEWFRLAYAAKWIDLGLLDQSDQARRFLSILLDPPSQVFKGR